MAKLLPVMIGVGIAGVAIAIGRESLATVNWEGEEMLPKSKGGKSSKSVKKSSAKTFAEKVKIAAQRLKSDIKASAYKWAKKRGLAPIDVLTTIVLESRGDPKARNLSAKEDSRGAMQVNIRAHGAALKKLGYKPDDLYKLDVGIEVGTYLLAAKLKAVKTLVAQSTRTQPYDLGVLLRLYYAGPKYARAFILKGTHFKNMETYVDHWLAARNAVAEVIGEKGGAYA